MEDNLEQTESIADENATEFAKLVLLILLIALAIYKIAKGLQYWDIYAITFGYSSSKKIYQFKHLKSNFHRFLAIGECLLAILSAATYVKATW